jgi:LysR family transcriptional regulator, transcriptional activator of the cysJI operon
LYPALGCGEEVPVEFNLIAMRTLLEVSNRRSFSKAAQALHLTQPAVSLQIQNLENFFRTTLLIRGSAGKIELTDDGKTLCEYAVKMIELQKDLMLRMEHSMKDSFHRLRVGTCVIAGEHLFPQLINSFMERHPRFRLSISVLKCQRIFEGLVSSVFDIGITGASPPGKQLSAHEIFQAPVEFFEAGDGQPSPREFSLPELAKKPLIIREEGSGIWIEFVKFLRTNRFDVKRFNIISVSESNEAIKALVKSGVGFSLFPRFVVEDELRSGELKTIRLKEGSMNQTFYLTHRKKGGGTRPIREFYKFISGQADLMSDGDAVLRTA